MTRSTHPIVDPELDPALQALAKCRCRCILYRLEESDEGVVSFRELVDYILRHDPESTGEEEVILDLKHASLPKLESAGWIEYDPRSETVRYRSRAVPENLLTSIRALEDDS